MAKATYRTIIEIFAYKQHYNKTIGDHVIVQF